MADCFSIAQLQEALRHLDEAERLLGIANPTAEIAQTRGAVRFEICSPAGDRLAMSVIAEPPSPEITHCPEKSNGGK